MNNDTETLLQSNPFKNQTEQVGTQHVNKPGTSQMTLENVEDFTNVCRSCATVTELVIPIYAGEGLQNNLADKIVTYLPIEVSEDDDLPQVVCYQCASTLIAWHEFVQCSMQSDTALKTKLDTLRVKQNEVDHGKSFIIEAHGNITLKEIKVEVEVDSNELENDASQIHTRTETQNINKPLTITNEAGKKYAHCNICEKNISFGSWKRHMRAHIGEKRYSCHTCGLAFNDSGNLARHSKALHAKQRPFSCHMCDKTFSRNSHLRDHIKSHSESRDFVCDICGKASKSSAALRMHRKIHQECKFNCIKCGAKFKRRGELRAHVTVHTGEKAYSCSCGKSFRLQSQLNAHNKTHGKEFKDPTGFDDDSNMICEYCGVEQSEEDYPEHLITMHSEQLLPSREHDPFQYVMSDDDDAEEEPARKPKKAARAKKSKQAKPKKPKNTEPAERSRKSKKFKAKSRNKKETTRKSENKPTNSEVNSSHNNQQDKDPIASAPTVSEDLADGTPLQICEASQQIEVLMESVERIKVNKKKKRYRCTHCPREFRIPSSYSYHFRSVHGNYYYECDDCGKKFRNKQILAQHTTVHDKMRHKQCKYCQKRFRTRANLYTHEQTHIDLNLKKWQCNECDRGFRWRTHLLRHMKRHSSDKSLVCLTCGRRFNIECDLRRHMLTHGSGNFNCRKCNSRFSQLRYLRVHMQKKHDEIIDGN